MKKFAIIFVAAAAASANATIVIDDFTSGSASGSIKSGTQYYAQTGTMLGGTRGVMLKVIDNPRKTSLDFDIDGGFSNFSEGSRLSGEVALAYGYTLNESGAPKKADLNADLSKESAFKVDFDYLDHDIDLALNLDSHYTYVAPIAASDTPFSVLIPFTAFAGYDFSDTDNIVLAFQLPQSTDLSIKSVEAVPEPATMAALGLGLVAFARRRRAR